MKKYIILVFSLVLLLSFSSCSLKNDIKEIKIKGKEMNETELTSLVEKYENHLEEEKKDDEKKVFDGWIKINVDLIYESTYKEESAVAKVNISGKIYESNYLFEQKMVLDLKLEVDTTENDNKTKVTADINIKYIEGNYYMKGKVSAKEIVDGSETKTETNIQHILDINDALGSIPGLDIELLSGKSTLDSLFSVYVEGVSEVGENDKFYQDGNNYFYESSVKEEFENGNYEKSLSQLSFELEENSYTTKKMKLFVRNDSKSNDKLEVMKVSGEISKSMGTIIKKPSNLEDYGTGDLDIPGLDDWL